jgi:predicted transcriptional regulator
MPESIRRSKLEMSISLLEFLFFRGPSKTTHLINRANMSHHILMKVLKGLIKQKLVEERHVDGKSIYKITKKGINALKGFLKFKKIFLEESKNQFERISEFI